MNKRVYLAGPITGCSYEFCTNWRKDAQLTLKGWDIVGVSPMRTADYPTTEEKIKLEYNTPLCNSRGITVRSRYDVMSCDLVLVNFLGAKAVSIGTIMEIAWADMLRKPLIIVMEDEGNPHDYPMITEALGFRVNNMEEGLKIVKTILTH